jgi:hypothetical protein
MNDTLQAEPYPKQRCECHKAPPCYKDPLSPREPPERNEQRDEIMAALVMLAALMGASVECADHGKGGK